MLPHNETVRGEGRKTRNEESKETRLVLSQEPSCSKYLGKAMVERVTNYFNMYCSDIPLSPLEPQPAASRSTRKYLGIVGTEKKS